MMFNKKMLGSCCVGLALLLSGEGFGMQKEYTVGAGKDEVKIAVADVEKGIEAFKTIGDWETKKSELTSYWDVYTAAYVMAQKGVEVGDVKKSMTPDQVIELVDWKVYDAVVNFPGGEELFVDIVNGEYNVSKPGFSGKMKSKVDGDDIEEEWKQNSSSSSDDEGQDDDAIFSRSIQAADYLKELKAALQEIGEDVKEFNLSETQKKIFENEKDPELKDIVGDGFAAAFHLFAYLEKYYYEKVLPVPASLEKLRDKYFALMAEVAEANKVAGESVKKITSLQQENEALKKDKSQIKVGTYTVESAAGKKLSNDVVVKGAFSVKSGELNGIAKVEKGKVSNLVKADKVGFYNKDEYGVHKTAQNADVAKLATGSHALYDVNAEDKYVKAGHEVIDTSTHTKVAIAHAKAAKKLEAGGHEVVETVHKNAVSVREKMLATVEGLKQSSTAVLGINAGVAVFGNGKTVQAAAQGEVDAVMTEIVKVTPVFGAIDLAKLETGDITVLNSIATKLLSGDWSSIDDDTNGVKDATLKGILDTAKTLVAGNVNDGAVANLITAEFGSLPNVAPTADAVRKALLIAALAGKDANAIKTSIDN